MIKYILLWKDYYTDFDWSGCGRATIVTEKKRTNEKKNDDQTSSHDTSHLWKIVIKNNDSAAAKKCHPFHIVSKSKSLFFVLHTEWNKKWKKTTSPNKSLD